MVRNWEYYCLNLNWVLEGNLKLFPFMCGFGLYYAFWGVWYTCRTRVKNQDFGNRKGKNSYYNFKKKFYIMILMCQFFLYEVLIWIFHYYLCLYILIIHGKIICLNYKIEIVVFLWILTK
jgi:hypothetical protein